MNKTRPIILIRKKGGHAGHHGGAWKVAYADFVTAMMALFIVLWLMNWTVREVSGSASEEKKAAVRARETAPSIENPRTLGLDVIAGATFPSTRTPRMSPVRSTTATIALSADVAAAGG